MTRLLLSASVAVLLAACGGPSESPETPETEVANSEAANSEAVESGTGETQASEASVATNPVEIDGPTLDDIASEDDPEVRLALLEARSDALQAEGLSRFQQYLAPVQAELDAVIAAMEAAQADIEAAAAANVAPIIAEARACQGGVETAPDFTPPEPSDDMTAVESNAMITQALMLAAEASPCVYALPSGLRFRIDRVAEDGAPVAQPGEMVEVHYEGTLPNGDVFDSSYQREETINFPSNGVIQGWVQALAHMRVGEQWTLFIPADLGYGQAGRGPIGPNEAMRFKVELISLPNRMIDVRPTTDDTETDG